MAVTDRVVNGMEYRVRSAGRGPTLMLLHGFTGTGEAWSPFMSALAENWRVIAPDLPGHGGTDAPEDIERYTMAGCVADLAVLLDEMVEARGGDGRVVVVGYSMGGRVALHFARAYPERVRGLIVESANPGIRDEAERRARLEQDEQLARFLEKEGVAAFVERWENIPLFASQARLSFEKRERLRQRRLQQAAAGLAGSLRGMGAGVAESLWDELSGFAVPTLLLAGELDEKYCRIVGETAAFVPGAKLVVVPDAGHAVHFERPDTWLEHVQSFLGSFHSQ